MSSIAERVFHVIAEQMGSPLSALSLETTKEDLGMDSLDDVELVMALEDEFEREVPDSISEMWNSIQDVVAHFEVYAK